jgi:anaerobic selenocysteine-containing dehydrogenase
MKKTRREFIKASATVAVAAAAGAALAGCSDGKIEQAANGVVQGHSKKREVLYKKSAAWDEFYEKAL